MKTIRENHIKQKQMKKKNTFLTITKKGALVSITKTQSVNDANSISNCLFVHFVAGIKILGGESRRGRGIWFMRKQFSFKGVWKSTVALPQKSEYGIFAVVFMRRDNFHRYGISVQNKEKKNKDSLNNLISTQYKLSFKDACVEQRSSTIFNEACSQNERKYFHNLFT